MSPRIGQFVCRMLGKPALGYVSNVVSSSKGGNGTVVYRVEVEALDGTPEGETLVIVDGEGQLHETTQWQCSACECFATCICHGATREE